MDRERQPAVAVDVRSGGGGGGAARSCSSAILLTQELIRQRSDSAEGERALGELIAQRLTEAGLEVELRPWGEEGRCNLIARLRGRGELPICLCGHLDTVPLGSGWSREPLDGEIDRGMIWGRGASDMKSGLAAIVIAAERAALRAPEAREALMVVLTGAEEQGCAGARELIGRLEPARLLVVAEPTGNRLRLGHRGVVWLRGRSTGRAAHGATPEHGRNAIAAMTASLAGVFDYEHNSHPVLGPSSLNVGLIAGGIAPNVVPDRCEVTVDVRTLPGETAADWSARLSAASGTEVEWSGLTDLAAVVTAPDEPLLYPAAVLSTDAAGGAVAFATDACWLADTLHAPTVIWGPGEPAMMHVADEGCPIAAIDQAVQGLGRLLGGPAPGSSTEPGPPPRLGDPLRAG